tara:strand:+ start:647 stop:1438 length:792 start_codon:yes stop_codon:yes gene_type:complete
MKWRNSLTIMEATLAVCGFNIEDDIFNIEKKYSEMLPSPSLGSIEELPVYPYTKENIEEALAIYSGLLEQASLYSKHIKPSFESKLDRVPCPLQTYSDNMLDSNTLAKFTKESLRRWFNEFDDTGKAKKLSPNFELLNEDEINLLESLKLENKELKDKLESQSHKFLSDIEAVNIQQPEVIRDAEQEVDFSDLSKYLPVNGRELEILSSAWQNFPSRFEDYKCRNYDKTKIEEWLKSTYDCHARQQFVFADALMQNFLLKKKK